MANISSSLQNPKILQILERRKQHRGSFVQGLDPVLKL